MPPVTKPTPRASKRFANIAPTSDARTISSKPAFRATKAMINSGALPKVAFSRPPTASPVRVAICSVAWDDQRRNGNDRDGRHKEHHRRGDVTEMFQDHCDWNEHKQPVDRTTKKLAESGTM